MTKYTDFDLDVQSLKSTLYVDKDVQVQAYELSWQPMSRICRDTNKISECVCAC